MIPDEQRWSHGCHELGHCGYALTVVQRVGVEFGDRRGCADFDHADVDDGQRFRITAAGVVAGFLAEILDMIPDRQGLPAADLLRAIAGKVPLKVLFGRSRHVSASDAGCLSRYRGADKLAALAEVTTYAVTLVAALDRVRSEVIALAEPNENGALFDRGTFAEFVLGHVSASEIPRGSAVLWSDAGQAVKMTDQLRHLIAEYT